MTSASAKMETKAKRRSLLRPELILPANVTAFFFLEFHAAKFNHGAAAGFLR